jgi:hypothetical protein
VALAEIAMQPGQAACFLAAQDLVTEPGRTCRKGQLDRGWRIYLAPKVLIGYGMGSLLLDGPGADIFFPARQRTLRKERYSSHSRASCKIEAFGSFMRGDCQL